MTDKTSLLRTFLSLAIIWFAISVSPSWATEKSTTEEIFDTVVIGAASAVGTRIAGSAGGVAGAAVGVAAAKGIKKGAKATKEAAKYATKVLTTPPDPVYFRDPITGRASDPIYFPFYRK